MAPEFLSHLEELRKRLIVSAIAFGLGAILCYFFSGRLIEYLIHPLHRFENAELIFQTPYEAFLTHLKVAGLGGLVLSSPVLFTQMWLFVSPGLYEQEKKSVIPLIVVSFLLFLCGTGFAYYLVIPLGLHFLLSFQTESLRPLLAIGPYFSFLIGMIIAFGVLFDFPVFIIGVVRLGITDSSTLRKARKTIIVIIFIAAAILTPSPDPISQLLLAVPLLVLFEVSLFIAKCIERQKSKA
ncbi:MAG: twin-arginine translocase subunit TatC [Candidatus Omnitrophota bacterium]|nr:twin-arginine translocase subunit TatC [Candidatus Omnitrophota bacterium]